MTAPWAVDLFAGRGGWSRGLLAAGFRVEGYDIEPQPDYPAEATFVQADVRDLDGRAFRGAAVIVASPPCQGFSQAVIKREHAKDRPRVVDLELLCHALRVIREAEPRFWAIENVQGALAWWRPLLGEPALKNRPYFVWGHFPPFLLPRTGQLKIKTGTMEPKWRNSRRVYLSAGERAEIPRELAEPFARACLDALSVPCATGRPGP